MNILKKLWFKKLFLLLQTLELKELFFFCLEMGDNFLTDYLDNTKNWK